MGNHHLTTGLGITPHNYCKSCDDALKRVVRGKIHISTRQLPVWRECSDARNCSSCLLVLKRKGGGRQKKVSISYGGLRFPKPSKFATTLTLTFLH